jgi:hypothetical protein
MAAVLRHRQFEFPPFLQTNPKGCTPKTVTEPKADIMYLLHIFNCLKSMKSTDTQLSVAYVCASL